MYCNNCGNKMNENQAFCSGCGNRAGMGGMGMPGPTHVIQVREKSTGIAAILSLVWAGLGQLYVGKIGRGIGLMILHFFMIFILATVVLASTIFAGIGGALIGGTVFIGVWVAIWVWNIFDAHKLANRYNDSQRESGRRPW